MLTDFQFINQYFISYFTDFTIIIVAPSASKVNLVQFLRLYHITKRTFARQIKRIINLSQSYALFHFLDRDLQLSYI